MSDLTTVIPRGFAGFSFDAVLSEEHTLELDPTDNPVETGVSITDHAIMKPAKVKMIVGVSNTQLRQIDGGFGVGASRTKNAYAKLKALMQSRNVFDVQTGLTLYSNMLCTNLSVSQDASSANAVEFTADLREIIIVQTQTVTYPARKAGKAHNQASQKNGKGEQQGGAVTPKKSQSILKTLAGVLGGSR